MLELPVFQSLFQILPSQKHPQQAYLQRVVQGLAVLAFMAFSTQVKSQSSDAAGVKVLGQVTTVSCQLVMTTDVNPNLFTTVHKPFINLDLGSGTLAAANAANVGSTFGEAKTIFLFTSRGPGRDCSGGPTFDIGLTINQDKVVNVGTNSFLRSNDSAPGGVAQGVALSLIASHRNLLAPNTDILGEGFLNFRNTASGIGPLLSGKSTLIEAYDSRVAPLGNARLFALKAQFVKTSATVTPGSYLTNITVNLWWR